MSKLYVIGHGEVARGSAPTFVPTGKTVHTYAEPGETVSAAVAQMILSRGGSETGLRQAREGDELLNWSLFPDDDAELQGDLTAITGNLDGNAHVVTEKVPLCTSPGKCLAELRKWRGAVAGRHRGQPRPPLHHHRACRGFITLYPEHDEVHLLVCQSYEGVADTGMQTGIPQYARDDRGDVVVVDGKPVIQVDGAAYRGLEWKANRLMEVAHEDPLRALNEIRMLPDAVVAQLRVTSSWLSEWIDEQWALYQKTAPAGFRHDGESTVGRVAQYHEEQGAEVHDGWLGDEFREAIRGAEPPADFEECMSSTTWDEVFFQWFQTAHLPTASTARDDETAYYLRDMVLRWFQDPDSLHPIDVADFIRSRAWAAPEAGAHLADLEGTIAETPGPRWDLPTSSGRSVEDGLGAVLQTCATRLDALYALFTRSLAEAGAL